MERFRITAAALLVLSLTAAHASAGGVTAFGPGERLEYVLKWAGIPAGDSVMKVVAGDPFEGEVLFEVVSTARSRSLVDVFYKVRNRYETHILPSDGLTRRYIFAMNEGGKKKNRLLLFDQEQHTLTRIVQEAGETQSQVYEIPENCQDNLSSLYAMRNEDFEVGDSLTFFVFEGKKTWELVVDVLAEEKVEVRAGRFTTLKVHPKLKFEGIFRRKGELHVWMTKDRHHVPVLMKSQVRIGSIDAELVDYTLGRTDGTVTDEPEAGEVK